MDNTEPIFLKLEEDIPAWLDGVGGQFVAEGLWPRFGLVSIGRIDDSQHETNSECLS